MKFKSGDAESTCEEPLRLKGKRQRGNSDTSDEVVTGEDKSR